MRVNFHIVSLVDAVGQFCAGQHEVHESTRTVHKRMRILKPEQTKRQAATNFVRGIHHTDAEHVKLSQLCWCLTGQVTVETGWGQERVAIDTSLRQLVEPFTRYRVGVAENVEAIELRFSRLIGPVQRGQQGQVSILKLADVGPRICWKPTVFGVRQGVDAELRNQVQVCVGVNLQLLV